jgi:hypothetical protein
MQAVAFVFGEHRQATQEAGPKPAHVQVGVGTVNGLRTGLLQRGGDGDGGPDAHDLLPRPCPWLIGMVIGCGSSHISAVFLVIGMVIGYSSSQLQKGTAGGRGGESGALPPTGGQPTTAMPLSTPITS